MNFWIASPSPRRNDPLWFRRGTLFGRTAAAVLLASMAWAAMRGAAGAEVNFVDGRQPDRPVTPPAETGLREKLAAVAGADSVVDTVLAHYHENGQPVTEVEVLPAAKADGSFTVKISEGRIGNVTVEADSSWMAGAVLAGTTDLQGAPLTLGAVVGRLDWLHRNPLHAVTLGFRPGDAPATADAVFTVRGTRPWRLFGGWNNDGVDPLPEHRFSAGFEVADAFGWPVWMSAEASLGEDPQTFQAYRGTLRWFLPWRHEWRVSGGWTEAKIDALPAPLTGSELHDWSVSSRYVVPVAAVAGATVELGVGGDFRRTDSTVFLGGAAVGADADTAQAALDLSIERTGKNLSWGNQLSLLWSPGGLTDGNETDRHAALRPGAEADYTALRGSAWARWDWSNGWAISSRTGWQWSAAPVLPSEEMPIGGSSAVRGYPEAAGLGDDGMWGNLELEAPRLPLWPGAGEPVPPTWQPIAFFDAGWSADRARDDDASLASAGLGVRVRWSRHAALALDYGWRLTEPGGRLHLALRVEF